MLAQCINYSNTEILKHDLRRVKAARRLTYDTIAATLNCTKQELITNLRSGTRLSPDILIKLAGLFQLDILYSLNMQTAFLYAPDGTTQIIDLDGLVIKGHALTQRLLMQEYRIDARNAKDAIYRLESCIRGEAPHKEWQRIAAAAAHDILRLARHCP